jgi:ADP-ribosylglycohydrolase
MIINEKELYEKILGCWYGKSIGGTLGAPLEWKRQINNVDFYTQKLDGNPAPNDDLDIQLLWLIALEEQNLNIDTRILAYYFNLFVTPHWAEYGNAKANMKIGINSPDCGKENNIYNDSCGSYIRSEIWACLAAGTPELAVSYMLADSAIDHGGKSEGTYSAIAIAALEAAAFIESDINILIEIALSYIPNDCAIYKVTRLVQECYKKGINYLEVRDKILEKYRGAPFSYFDGEKTVILCDKNDIAKGFQDGKKGYDAPDNFGIIILGLLYGQGDFSKTLCYAVNCGEDTDCTAATLGSILGIIGGYSKIPEKWIKPIGSKIITCSLNLGELERMIPINVEELTDRTLKLTKKMSLIKGLNFEIKNEKTALDNIKLKGNSYFVKDLYKNADNSVYDFNFFKVTLEYISGCYLKNNRNTVKIKIENKYRVSENLDYKWYLEDGFTIKNDIGSFYLPRNTYGNPEKELEFTIVAEEIRNTKNRFVFELTINGKAETMLIPVLLIKGADNV